MLRGSSASDERLTSCGDCDGGVNSCIDRLRLCDDRDGRYFSGVRLPASNPSV
jgi:hypothetical protein